MPDGEMGPYPLSDASMPPDGEMGPYPLSDGSMAPDGEMGPYPLSDNTNLLGAQSQYSLYRNYGTQYATTSISSNQRNQTSNQQQYNNHTQSNQQLQPHQNQTHHYHQYGANTNYGSSHSGYSYVVGGDSYKNHSHNQVNRGGPNPSRSGSGPTMMMGGSGRCLMLAVQRDGHRRVSVRRQMPHSHHSNATIQCASNSNSPVPRRRAQRSHGGRQDSFRRHSAHGRITSTSGACSVPLPRKLRTILHTDLLNNYTTT